MKVNRAVLKTDAKAALRESKTSPYLVALIYVAIAYVLSLLHTKITGIRIDYETFMYALDSQNYDQLFYLIQQQSPGAIPRIIGSLLSIMSSMVGIGFTVFALLISRRQENTVGNLFDAFGNFFRFLWLLILIWFFTFVWSLLFVIPGIVAAYRYRQAIYILIDNPDMRAIDCIRKSKEMMKGHKGELFILDLSFLGWYILCIIPFLPIYVYPYTETTYAAYYNSLLNINADFGQSPPSSSSEGSRYTTTNEDGLPPWEYKD